MREFETSEGAIAPVNDVAQFMADPHVQARQDIISIPDQELGQVKMQNVFPSLSRTPGRIKHAGPAKGAHNDEILRGELNIDEAELARLRSEGVV